MRRLSSQAGAIKYFLVVKMIFLFVGEIWHMGIEFKFNVNFFMSLFLITNLTFLVGVFLLSLFYETSQLAGRRYPVFSFCSEKKKTNKEFNCLKVQCNIRIYYASYYIT